MGGALFLTLTAVGLVGLFLMAIPAFGRHGHAHTAHGGAHPTAGHAPQLLGGRVSAGSRTASVVDSAGAAAGAASAASAGREVFPSEGMPARILGWVPSPRAVCSGLALYGAFGNALVHAGHLRFSAAALLAVAPALLIERLVVRPVWNLVFRFQGQPSSPLDALLLSEAQAVVAFRNGRGIVSVVRDGRVVQLAAALREDQAETRAPRATIMGSDMASTTRCLARSRSLVSLAGLVALVAAPSTARANDPDAARIAAAGHSLKWNWTPPGRSDRYGHGETLVRAPLSAVRAQVLDFEHYRDFMPDKFKTSRVVGHGADGSVDVYIQILVMGGVLTLWDVTRFAAPKTIGPGTDVIEGRMLRGKGNVEDVDVIWTLRSVDADVTVLKFDVLLKTGLPVPQWAMDIELRDSATCAVDAIHDRAQGSPGIRPWSPVDGGP